MKDPEGPLQTMSPRIYTILHIQEDARFRPGNELISLASQAEVFSPCCDGLQQNELCQTSNA